MPALTALALASSLIVPAGDTPHPAASQFLSNSAQIMRSAIDAVFCGQRGGTWAHQIGFKLGQAAFNSRDTLARELDLPVEQVKGWTIGVISGEVAVRDADDEARGHAAVCDPIAETPGWNTFLGPLDRMGAGAYDDRR